LESFQQKPVNVRGKRSPCRGRQVAQQVVRLGGDTKHQELQSDLQCGEIMRGPADQAQDGIRGTSHGVQPGVEELGQEGAAERAIRDRLRPEVVVLDGSR